MNESQEEVIPLTWDNEVVDRINISISPLTEYGLPWNRRGMVVQMPSREEDQGRFIEDLTSVFKRTLELIVKGEQ